MPAATPTSIGVLNGYNNAGATVFTLTTTAAVPAGGSIIIAGLYFPNTTTLTITDNATGGSNSYTIDASVADGTGIKTYVASVHNCRALPLGSTITFTYSATVNWTAASALQTSGLQASATLDATATAVTGTSTALSTGTTAATAQADELAIVAFGTYLSSAGPDAATLAAGYTALAVADANNGTGAVMRVTPGYKLLAATGTQTETATAAAAPTSAAGLIVTYKALVGPMTTTIVGGSNFFVNFPTTTLIVGASAFLATLIRLPATAAQIADALAGRYGPVVLRYRFEQRDLANNFIADASTAIAIDGCQLTLQNDQPVSRTATFTVLPSALPAGFDASIPSHKCLAVFADVLVIGSFERFPLGLFQFDLPEKSYAPNAQSTWNVQASDVTIVLADRNTTAPYTVTKGTNYGQAIATILAQFNLSFSLPATSAVTPIDFTWPANIPWIQIVGDLCFGINWYPVWADATGVVTTRLRIDPATEPAAVSYTTEADPLMVLPPFVTRQNVSQFPNVCTVSIDDPLRLPSVSMRTNTDARSPLSTPNSGKTLLQEIKGGGQPDGRMVLDSTTADQIADFTLREANALAQPADLTTLADPRRTNREWYTLTVERTEVASRWRVIGWQLDCKPGGQMKHSIGRAQALTTS